MAEAIERHTALAGLRLPAGDDDLAVEERAGLKQLQLIARSGRRDALAAAIGKFLKRKNPLSPFELDGRGGVLVCAVGPDEFWVNIEDRAQPRDVREFEKLTDSLASAFDQTDGRFVVRLSGRKAVDVLARGTSLDLQNPSLPAQWGSNTSIGHIPALLLCRREKNAVYDVSAPRSYAGSFIAWLRAD